MNILIEQIKKISIFIVILIVLLLINLFFSLNFRWTGILLISKIYILLFSFYLIFNFSLIPVFEMRKDYRERYGDIGIYYVFLITRIVPIASIFFITVLFAFMEYVGSPHWQINLVFFSLSGGYSHALVYSVFLLLVLRLKKNPGVTIPYFLLLSLTYFIVDKIVYIYFPSGTIITGVKIFKYIFVLFLIIFEFFFKDVKIVKTIIIAFISGLLIYSFVVGTYSYIFYSSELSSYGQVKAGKALLKIGYSYPLKNFKKSAVIFNDSKALSTLLNYSKKYDFKINLTTKQWNRFFLNGTLKHADKIAEYIINENVKLDSKKMILFLKNNAALSGSELIGMENIIKYITKYYFNKADVFIDDFHNKNIYYKLFLIKVMKESENIESIPLLVDLLTDINYDLSSGAYDALSKITGYDFVKEYNFRVNSPEVVRSFMNYYKKNRVMKK